jgi:alpha-glucoside transport system permease protein
MNIAITIFFAIVGIPAALIAYIYASEFIVSIGGGDFNGRSQKGSPWIRRLPLLFRHWLWLLPALVLLGVGLVYPVVTTVIMSFQDKNSSGFVGFANFAKIFTDSGMLIVLRNNLLWLVLFTGGTLLFGLVIAVLSDRIQYESAVKAMIFVPMAISFVAAGIIWSLVFAYMPQGEKQIGILNAVLTTVDPKAQPQAWLSNMATNNIALIMVGVWMWTGFSMVILSAGLKSIPAELQEAARVDGATELQLFTGVTWPLLLPTIGVVAMTLIMNVLKIFDVVYVMTNGNLGTEVIANRMYKEMFNYHDFGVSSALAVLLMVIMIPFMVYRVREYKKGGKS